MTIFENSRWPTVAIFKIVFGHNSAFDCPISVKFCIWKQLFTEFQYGTDTRLPRTVGLIFSDAAWDSSSGVFCIVFDTLVYIAHRRRICNVLGASVYVANRDVFKHRLRLFPPITDAQSRLQYTSTEADKWRS